MCPSNNKDSITAEVELRLDDLFSENKETSEAPVTKAEAENVGGGNSNHPLRELKSVILAIDWEITNENMTKFVDQVEKLKDQFKEDRINLMFLQLLGSLGEYIKTNKGESHPNSFKLLNSVFNQLETTTASADIDEAKKKKSLFVELNKYKELKEEIALSKIEKKKKQEPLPTKYPESEDKDESDIRILKKVEEDFRGKISKGNTEKVVTATQFEEALNEIKQLIVDEFKKLKQEIKLGREV